MEAWWADAHDNPAAFRDPASVSALIAGALSAAPDEREAAAGALSSVVKALEDDPVDESLRIVARRMPELVRGLADPDPYYSGQLISIARRIPIDLAATGALLNLIAATPAAENRVLPISALGKCQDAAWSDRVEQTLAAALGNRVTFGAAVDGLYYREHRIRNTETVRALGEGALKAAFPATGPAIATLFRLLLHSRFAVIARTALEKLAAVRPELRDEIAALRASATPRT